MREPVYIRNCPLESNGQKSAFLPMKSAYELAMERLEKQSPSVPVTERQKQEIAGIDSSYRAKIAEKEVFLGGELAKARASGDATAIAELERQLSSEIRRLQADCEDRKEKVRHGAR